MKKENKISFQKPAVKAITAVVCLVVALLITATANLISTYRLNSAKEVIVEKTTQKLTSYLNGTTGSDGLVIGTLTKEDGSITSVILTEDQKQQLKTAILSSLSPDIINNLSEEELAKFEKQIIKELTTIMNLSGNTETAALTEEEKQNLIDSILAIVESEIASILSDADLIDREELNLLETAITEKIEAINIRLRSYDEQFTGVNTKIKKLEEQLSGLSSSSSNYSDDDITNISNDLNSTITKLSNLTKDYNQYVDNVNYMLELMSEKIESSLYTSNTGLQKQIDQLKEEDSSLVVSITNLQTSMESANNVLNQTVTYINDDVDSLKKKVGSTELGTENQDLSNAVNEINSNFKTLDSEVAVNNEKLSESIKQVGSDLTEAVGTINSDISSIDSKVDESNKELSNSINQVGLNMTVTVSDIATKLETLESKVDANNTAFTDSVNQLNTDLTNLSDKIDKNLNLKITSWDSDSKILSVGPVE